MANISLEKEFLFINTNKQSALSTAAQHKLSEEGKTNTWHYLSKREKISQLAAIIDHKD